MTRHGGSRCLLLRSGPTVLPSASRLATHPSLWPMVLKPSCHSISRKPLTYLLPPLDFPTSTETLIAYRVTQLLKHPEDLCDMAGRILRARKISAAQFAECFAGTIQDHDFAVGSLVLVQNSRIEKELNRKTKLRYLGPMIVVHRTQGGTYILTEMDGTVSRLRYAAFRLLPYLPHTSDNISPTAIVAADDLADLDLSLAV